MDAVGAGGIPAGGAGLVVLKGERGALGGGHFSGGDEFVFGGGAVVTGDDALLAEENGAVGAGGAGEFHEGGEIEGVAAEGALADDEVVEEALVEPGREIAAEDGVFAMIDTGGEAEAAGGTSADGRLPMAARRKRRPSVAVVTDGPWASQDSRKKRP